jgi:outer membrane protein assembly factor BamB
MKNIEQLLISGTNRVRGYDLDNGQVIWECGGLSSNIVASPVSGDGMVFAGSSYDKRALLAIRLDGAAGDITGTDRIAWNRFRVTPYVPSPLLYDGGFYFLTHYQGTLSRVDARTGEERSGAFRLKGISDVYASPVAAAGRIYVTDRDGTTVIVSSGDVPRLLALNHRSEPISASAAIAGGQLFLRRKTSLLPGSRREVSRSDRWPPF